MLISNLIFAPTGRYQNFDRTADYLRAVFGHPLVSVPKNKVLVKQKSPNFF